MAEGEEREERETEETGRKGRGGGQETAQRKKTHTTQASNAPISYHAPLPSSCTRSSLLCCCAWCLLYSHCPLTRWLDSRRFERRGGTVRPAGDSKDSRRRHANGGEEEATAREKTVTG